MSNFNLIGNKIHKLFGEFIIKPIIIVIILFVYISLAHSQINNDLTLIIKGNSIINLEQSKALKHAKLENVSEVKFLFLGLIKFYQTYISSQQSKQVCIFYPSCSHFGQEAIQKYGLFYGSLMTSDRLQRCNGFSMEYYKIDLQTGKCFDKVDNYYIGSRK
jgi:uncharacterized protein